MFLLLLLSLFLSSMDTSLHCAVSLELLVYFASCYHGHTLTSDSNNRVYLSGQLANVCSSSASGGIVYSPFWVFARQEFTQVWSMLRQSLRVHMGICPVVPGKRCFPKVTHYHRLMQSFCPLFLKDPWALRWDCEWLVSEVQTQLFLCLLNLKNVPENMIQK